MTRAGGACALALVERLTMQEDSEIVVADRSTHATCLPKPSRPRVFSPNSAAVDIEIVLARLRALVGDQYSDAITFVHHGPPISKGLAKWSKKSTGSARPRHLTEAQTSVARLFREALGSRHFTQGVAIVAIFFRQNRKRVDLDNLAKLVLDAGTEAQAWVDDSQVCAHTAMMQFDRERPRTVVALCEFRTSLTDARRPIAEVCKHCRRAYTRPGWWAENQPDVYVFCSHRCSAAARRALAVCSRCDIEFRRKYRAQRYCSVACANRAKLPRPRTANLRPRSRCQQCGAPVSRREYRHCWQCYRKDDANQRVAATERTTSV